MARSLNFDFGDETYAAALVKLDREKLYGRVDKKYYDRAGQECYFGSVSEDGARLFGREAFQSAYLDINGECLERSALKVVDVMGVEIEKHSSSFAAPLVLEQQVSADEYLKYYATSVYQLDAPQALLNIVAESEKIYTFPFNYTASYRSSQGFLISANETLYLIVGQASDFDFLSLEQYESPYADEAEDNEDEDDDIDFSMF